MNEQQARSTTWAGLGTDVSGCKSYEEVLQRAGLDYDVVKRPILVEGFEGYVEGTVATVRESGPLHTFGFVSPDYEVCQNRDAFDFISDINKDMNFIKAGMTNGRIWIIGQLPEIEVLGDKVSPHLIFQNSHDGKHAILTNLCMLRIACQNQFNHSFAKGANVIKIRHSGMINERLAEARKVIAGAYDYVGKYQDLANRFAVKKVNDSIFQKILAEMFDVDTTKGITSKQQEKMDAFAAIYGNEDNQNFRGTSWGVLNAYTDFATHYQLPRETLRSEERRFISTTVESSKIDRVVEILEAIN